MPVRTFFALDIDDVLRSRLAEVEAALSGDEKITWVKPVNLHVTLNFLGSVPDEMIADVCNVGRQVASGIEPFDFHVTQIVCVPPRGRLRMIWAAVSDPTGRMARLNEELSLALGELGLRQEDRQFKGHVTFARVRFAKDASRLRAAAQQYAADDFPAQHADELVAYTSRLTPDGPIYTPVARAKLGQ